MSFGNREQVAAKVMSEGGITEALDYGLTADDMPQGDTELRQAWQEAQDAYLVVEAKVSRIRELLPGAEYI